MSLPLPYTEIAGRILPEKNKGQSLLFKAARSRLPALSAKQQPVLAGAGNKYA